MKFSPAPAVFLFIALLTAVLGGCAVVPQPVGEQENVAWQRHLTWVQGQPDWRLKGRFALSVGHRGLSGGLEWQQEGSRYRIEVFGPLGRTQAILKGGIEWVSLKLAGKPPRTARSASGLMRETLGWSLPVAGLRFWVRGISAPDSAPVKMRIDGAGRAVFIRQDGWKIHYLEYDVALGPQALPTRIRLVHGDVRIMLLIDRWENG